MASDKKHGLGRGIGSLLGNFDFDSQVENIISKNTQPVQAEEPKKKAADTARKAAKENPAVSEILKSTVAEGIDADRISAIYVPIKNVSANPNQPRKAFDEESLKELAASIKEQGIIQPIVVEEIVHGKYSIIAGERRFRAAKMAGLDKVPVIIKSLTEQQRIQMSLVENIQRENLNPIEEASAYQYLIQRSGLSQEEIGNLVGKSRSAIANSIRLLSLPDDLKDDLIAGMITPGHARAILSLVNPGDRTMLRDEIVNKELSVRKAEQRAEELNKGQKLVKPAKEAEDDPRVAEVTDKFVSALGSKCKITGDLNKGKIVIRYRSERDLERLYSRITGEDLFNE